MPQLDWREQQVALDVLAPLRAVLEDRYLVEREIGRGSMATVYLAYDVRHGRRVALKVLRAEIGAIVGAERFRREIQIAATLVHPHIVPILDSGEANDQLYYVMSYVEGQSLRERLARVGRLPIGEALRVASEVADALGFAHAHGVIHRDIKPENILLSGDHAFVADFGIACTDSDAANAMRLTGSGIVVGTPAYMSPEQGAGESALGPSSDIYALGCVCFEMLAGTHPFAAPTVRAMISRQLREDPPALRTLRSDVTPQAEVAIARALAKSPADRYQSAAEFAAALQSPDFTGRAPFTGPRPTALPRFTWYALAAVVAVALAWGWLPSLVRLRSAIDPELYVVLPFEHSSAKTSPVLDGAQCGRLAYDAMRHWHDLRIADPLRVRELLNQKATRSMSLSAAIAVARRLGAGHLVWGEVSQIADTLVVRGVLYDTRSPRAPPEEYIVRVAVTEGDLAPKFAELASGLLAPRHGPAQTPLARSTNSRAAWLALDRGEAALEVWDLPRAATEFRSAVAHDPEYAEAHFSLAQTLGWMSDTISDEWRGASARAWARRASLPPTDAVLAEAQYRLTSGAFQEACRQYQSLIERDSASFAAWFGFAECHARDDIVLRDPRSPSQWRFRSSYEAAINAYRRALTLVPSFQEALPSGRLTRLLFADASRVRAGRPLAGDGPPLFFAVPELVAETLSFTPRPVPEYDQALLAGRSPAFEAALARNRGILRAITLSWVRAQPASPVAYEELALLLERSGELVSDSLEHSALHAVRRARSFAATRSAALRLGVMEVRVRLKLGDMAVARALADTLLETPDEGLSAFDAHQLAGVAALRGRVFRAARLHRLRAARNIPIGPDGSRLEAPIRLREMVEALHAFAAFGGPADSLLALDREITRQVAAWKSPRSAESTHDALTYHAWALAYPEMGPQRVHRTLTTVPLLALQNAVSRGDSARASAGLSQWERGLERTPAISPSFGYELARLALARADTARAIRWLDQSLTSPAITTLPYVPDAAGLVRSMALRATLAGARREVDVARARSAAVLELWSGADAPLQPILQSMREVQRSLNR